MTDYVVTNGKIANYPRVHFGSYYAGGSIMTFCEPADFAALDANVLAIPNLPISVLSSSPLTVAEEFFGMSVQKRSNDALAGVTSKTVRSHDIANGKGRWKYIEIHAGVFDWADLDSWVNTHYAAGRHMIFTLFGTPTFYSARPTEQGVYGSYNLGVQAEPSDMTKWDIFCAAVATRYFGKIKYYEVWNEPNYQNNGITASGSTFFYSGTFAKLSELVRRASQAIKSVDPTAKIISPAIQGWTSTSGASDTYFTGMMSAATGDGMTTMKDWVDIVGVHLYMPSPNRTQDLAGMIDRINASKIAAGVSSLPTWDTESAPIGPDVSLLTEAKAKQIIARAMITMAAKGIARSVYYQYDHDTMGIINRPEIAAYREQIIALLRSGNILTVSRFTDGRVAYYTNSGLTII